MAWTVATRVGIDLVDVDEVREGLRSFGDRYVARLLTSAERAAVRPEADIACHVAQVFAAKEAVLKALGADVSQVAWTMVEVFPAQDGNWEITLSGEAESIATRNRVKGVTLSVATTRSQASAVAIATTVS